MSQVAYDTADKKDYPLMSPLTLTTAQIKRTAEAVIKEARAQQAGRQSELGRIALRQRVAEAEAVLAVLAGRVPHSWHGVAQAVVLCDDPDWDAYQKLKRKFGGA